MAVDRKKVLRGLAWVAESFGPLLVFYACEHTWGILAAIISSIAFGAALVVLQIVRDRKVSPFTAFIAGSVILFGFLDLRYQTGFFIKLEPALGNTATGLFFLGSVLWGRPLLIELAEKGMGKPLPQTAHPYLRVWTLLWALFFFLRAAGHVWLAYHVALDRALLLRGVVGPVSFAVMIGLELLVRTVYIRQSRAKRAAAELPIVDAALPQPD